MIQRARRRRDPAGCSITVGSGPPGAPGWRTGGACQVPGGNSSGPPGAAVMGSVAERGSAGTAGTDAGRIGVTGTDTGGGSGCRRGGGAALQDGGAVG